MFEKFQLIIKKEGAPRLQPVIPNRTHNYNMHGGISKSDTNRNK